MNGPDDTTAVLDFVLSRLEGVKRRGRHYDARCPAPGHGSEGGDHRPSLTITTGDRQPVVLDCKAGCHSDDVIAALGLTWADLSTPRDEREPGEWTPAGPASAVYEYTDEAGKLLFQVCRIPGPPKTFRQRVPDPMARSGWRWALGDTRRVLYRFPAVLAAVQAGRGIWLVEGERDVHALEGAGCVATCNPMGAGKWRPEYTEALRDAHVRIVADRDKPGRAHAAQVAEALTGVATTVQIVEAAEGKDAADHLAAGHQVTGFLHTWPGEPLPELDPDIHVFLAGEDAPEDWVVDGLLERGDRLMWTGREGLGKSVVLRQLAVCAAAGVHPFTGDPHEPRRVLVIDCENSERRNRRAYGPLVRLAARRMRPVPEGQLRIIHRPEGISLTDPAEAEWLAARVRARAPDLLVIGPLYKLHAVDANEETAARAIVAALDHALAQHDCALVLEAHAPHGIPTLRPVGSSLFMRWPDFGMGIAMAGKGEQARRRVEVRSWRGPRAERHWPRFLRWGSDTRGEWPWIASGRAEAEPENGQRDATAELEAEVQVPLSDLIEDAEQRAMGELSEKGLR